MQTSGKASSSVPGSPGSIYLFGDKLHQHRLLVPQLLSEFRVQTAGRGRKLEDWKMRPGKTENHLFDALVGCAVAASVCGLQWSASGEPVRAADEGKPIRLSELQRSKINGLAVPRIDVGESAAVPVVGPEEAKPIRLSDLQRARR